MNFLFCRSKSSVDIKPVTSGQSPGQSEYLKAIISYNSGVIKFLLNTIYDRVNKTWFLFLQAHNLVREGYPC